MTRQERIDWLCRLRSFLTQCGMPKEWRTNFHQALSDVIKSLEQEPKTGHWEWVQYDSNPNIGNWQCSECRCIVIECGDKKSKCDIPSYKYCPQCGCRIGK